MSDPLQQSSPNLIRVLIVDDHPLARNGLRFFLMAFADLELVGEAVDGQQAVRLCAQVRPDVVIMDVMMPGMDGISTTRAIRHAWPKIQVIALTAFPEKKLLEEVRAAGAINFLLKNVSASQLVDAIRAAYAGRSTVSPGVNSS